MITQQKIPQIAIYCQACGDIMIVTPNQARRKYCDKCRPAIIIAGGKLGGRGHKKNSKATP